MGVKKYFRKQFQKEMFFLQYDTVSDFYLSSFNKNRSPVPLLCIRLLLLLTCIGILIGSFIVTAMMTSASYWFVYLTHWGLVLITVTSAFAFAVSYMAYSRGSIDGTFGLPWYVKAYWVAYNTTVPIALFITLFYWTLLTDLDEEIEYAVSLTLDIFIHAVNSVLMLILVLTARHPTNILHFYFPILLGIVYVIFTVIYYYCGGTDMFGNSWIYPMLDWANPGSTGIMIVFSALGIFIVHVIVVGITAGRNAVSRLYRNHVQTFSLNT